MFKTNDISYTLYHIQCNLIYLISQVCVHLLDMPLYRGRHVQYSIYIVSNFLFSPLAPVYTLACPILLLFFLNRQLLTSSKVMNIWTYFLFFVLNRLVMTSWSQVWTYFCLIFFKSPDFNVINKHLQLIKL